MRVGGPADLFAEIHNLFPVRAIVRFARQRRLPHFILGRGSDLVISDKGIRGLVIHNRAQQYRFEETRFTADSGLPMARAATLGQAEGLSGAWNSALRSGTVGRTVWANWSARVGNLRRPHRGSRRSGRWLRETVGKDAMKFDYRSRPSSTRQQACPTSSVGRRSS